MCNCNWKAKAHSDKFLFWQEMIDEADRDGDGEINQEEFLRIMKKTSLYWVNSAGVCVVLSYLL